MCACMRVCKWEGEKVRPVGCLCLWIHFNNSGSMFWYIFAVPVPGTGDTAVNKMDQIPLLVQLIPH